MLTSQRVVLHRQVSQGSVSRPRSLRRPLSVKRYAVRVRASGSSEPEPVKVVKSAPSSPELTSGKEGIHNIEGAYWDAASEANTWYPCPPPSKPSAFSEEASKEAGNSASPHLEGSAPKPMYGSDVLEHSETPNTAASTDAYWDAAAQNEYSKGSSTAPVEDQ